MAYKITYETPDGSVEDYTTEGTKAAAVRLARSCAKGSSLNAAVNIERWFVEKDEMTVAAFPVAS
jgi:hypothetical protein